MQAPRSFQEQQQAQGFTEIPEELSGLLRWGPEQKCVCVCVALQRAMRLTAVQEAALREAHGQFVARQQSLAQQRSRALPHLQATLYTSGRTSVDDSLG